MISKKRLLEIDRERKQKLYNSGRGNRRGSNQSGKTGLVAGALVLVAVAGFFIYYANTVEPVPEQQAASQTEVAVAEQAKDVPVAEEVKVELHPSLQQRQPVETSPVKEPEEKKEQEVDEEQAKEPEKKASEKKEEKQARKKEAGTEKQKEEKKDEVKLTFYDNLPKEESTSLKESTKPSALTPNLPDTQKAKHPEKTNPSAKGDGSYRIQVISSRSEADAAKKKEQLVKGGFNAVMETVDLGSKGIWKRVYVGSYPSRESAADDLAKITKEYNLQPIIIKKQ